MKPYRILQDFAGNQTGTGPTEHFAAGTTAALSDHLAEVALKEGFVTPATAPEARETKVTAPAETKVERPTATKAAGTKKGG